MLFFCWCCFFEEPELDVRSHYAPEIVARNEQNEEEMEEEESDEEMEEEDGKETEVGEEETEGNGNEFSPEVTKFRTWYNAQVTLQL